MIGSLDGSYTDLCTVPARAFSAKGSLTIPSEYADMIPSLAYSVPDLEGNAQVILTAKDGTEVACLQTGVTNGKTVQVPAVSYVAAAVAAAALAMSLAGAAMSGGNPGTTTASPGFCEVMWWFQGMAMNGMHSVPYPTIYRSFSKNFAFSTGLVSWAGLQRSIDSFRAKTGGDLTDSNYDFLRDNATLIWPDNSTSTASSSFKKRSLLLVRQTIEIGNDTSSSSESNEKQAHFVDGIQGYVEQLTIPDANTFMTVLLVFAIVVAAIIVFILLFKVILEAWALFGKFPKSLTTFRKEYWRVIAQTIVSLILLLYGVWTLYCIFQFTHGDSWAAKLLAAVTLALFTAILAFYTWKIWSIVSKLKKLEGNTYSLYENKETWKKYKIFYENYKRGYWWLFIPFIVYMFAKGCVLAAGDGHGLVQTIGQLVIEAIMLVVLLWSRPYERKSGNWINIIIQVVRVLSVVCILIFVQELGVAQTTKTITGVVLIAVQSGLTAILFLLIVINSIITCCKENPHRKRRKAAEKHLSQDMEGDAFLLQPSPYAATPQHTRHLSKSGHVYQPVQDPYASYEESQETLVRGAADMGSTGYYSLNHGPSKQSHSPPPFSQEPRLPDMSYESYRHK